MLAVLAAMALQTAAAPSTSRAPAAPAPASPPSAPPMTSQDELVELQRVYAESCETRAYGTYDDICSTLADQIARFRRDMRRDRGRRDKPPASPAASPVSPPS